MRIALGLTLIAIPFMAIFIVASIMGGVLLAVLSFLAAAVIVAFIFAGVFLIGGV